MAELIEFDTERLRLRQWNPTDREPFSALNSDPRVMEFFPAMLTSAESDAMAARSGLFTLKLWWAILRVPNSFNIR